MVYEMYFQKYNTPQTVPPGVYSADAFASYAENFDLSLLPSISNDSEVPLSPQSQLTIHQQHQQHQLQQQQHQQHSIITTDYIPATIFHDPPISMKFEKDWKQLELNCNDFINHYPYQYYPSPLPSPPQEQNYSTIFPLSPCSPVDFNNFTIKQEIGILPPSPPDSNAPPSPLCDIKSEPSDTDTESCIDIESLLKDSLDELEETIEKKPVQDHQLLREYLQDTSFQKKHNLKPLALESLIGGWGTRGDIEPVFSLALEQIRRDVQATCAALDIPPDPLLWTSNQVQIWLESQITHLKLQKITALEQLFPENGEDLVLITEEEFIRRIPQSGATLYAQLEVWKETTNKNWNILSATTTSTTTITANNTTTSTTATVTTIPTTTVSSIPAITVTTEHHQQQTQNAEVVTDEEDEEMPEQLSVPIIPILSPSTPTPPIISSATIQQTQIPQRTGRQGGSHIHLWQFLKELLSAPQTHGTAIRWLDRTKGVFKIEDSVRVARLWGRRKNRPAMNYDKLSRSIRQYYKKGIMKKTERSQRLVYQFCHPYCL